MDTKYSDILAVSSHLAYCISPHVISFTTTINPAGVNRIAGSNEVCVLPGVLFVILVKSRYSEIHSFIMITHTRPGKEVTCYAIASELSVFGEIIWC